MHRPPALCPLRCGCGCPRLPLAFDGCPRPRPRLAAPHRIRPRLPSATLRIHRSTLRTSTSRCAKNRTTLAGQLQISRPWLSASPTSNPTGPSPMRTRRRRICPRTWCRPGGQTAKCGHTFQETSATVSALESCDKSSVARRVWHHAHTLHALPTSRNESVRATPHTPCPAACRMRPHGAMARTVMPHAACACERPTPHTPRVFLKIRRSASWTQRIMERYGFSTWHPHAWRPVRTRRGRRCAGS